jgi:hypothetical protein
VLGRKADVRDAVGHVRAALGDVRDGAIDVRHALRDVRLRRAVAGYSR